MSATPGSATGPQPPATGSMTAIVADKRGELTERRVVVPTPGPTEVLIRVRAVGINPIDWKTRWGAGVNWAFPNPEHRILGWDIAGEVAETGPGVNRFEVGDRVFGMPAFPHPANAYAQYVVARSRHVAATPGAITDVAAAATPLAALTAWQGLTDALNVVEGDRLLIHGASGGVGHIAVQLAKTMGAQVIGTASAERRDLLLEFGCDEVIDRASGFEDAVRDVDAVFDLYGGQDYPTRSLSCLRPGGRLLVAPSVADLPAPEVLESSGVTALRMVVEPDHTILAAVADLMAIGRMRVLVGRTLPLGEMETLHRLGQTGGHMGKLVATVDHTPAE